MKMSAVVTTSNHSKRYAAVNDRIARQTAEKLAVPYVLRQNYSLAELREQYGATHILVARKGLLELETHGGYKLFFHPGMAHLRIKNLRLCKSDYLVDALALGEGMSVLDCTLGMGADSIVLSYAVGDMGSVTALESSPLIERVIGYGLAHAVGENYDVHAAMRRIRTERAEALEFLRNAPNRAYDVVYFDPMFRHPFHESAAINALREVADDRAVSEELISEAKRVARQRIVIKESSLSKEFARLGFHKIVGGKYSKIHYGVIEV